VKHLFRGPDQHPFATLFGIVIALGASNFLLADPLIEQLGALGGCIAAVFTGVVIALAIRALALRLLHRADRIADRIRG